MTPAEINRHIRHLRRLLARSLEEPGRSRVRLAACVDRLDRLHAAIKLDYAKRGPKTGGQP
jgi:hypothetical protein